MKDAIKIAESDGNLSNLMGTVRNPEESTRTRRKRDQIIKSKVGWAERRSSRSEDDGDREA